MKRLFFYIIVIALFSVGLMGGVAHADTGDVGLRIDEATISRGFLFAHGYGEFKLSMAPDMLPEPTAFKMARLFGPLEAQERLAAPLGYGVASGVYVYDFEGASMEDLSEDVVLVFAYAGDDPEASIAFFDRVQKRWRMLPTHYYHGHLFAKTPFPYSQVAVLEHAEWLNEDGVDLSLLPARAAYIVDGQGRVLLSKRSGEQIPVASITKLMTALVFLDHNPGWEELVTIQSSDDTVPAKFNFYNGEQVRVRDLFYGGLVGSKNNAIEALVRATGMSYGDFVADMNQKASDLGMRDTVFVEATGLDKGNVSTARDVYRLADVAFGSSDIRDALSRGQYSFQSVNLGRWHTAWTTNKLLGAMPAMDMGKTGYIDASGYNFVAQGHEGEGRVVTVLLGTESEEARFAVARNLFETVFAGGTFSFRLSGF